MKKLRLFFTVLFLLTSLAVIFLIAVFENVLLFKAANMIKDNLWPAGIASFIFLILIFTAIVSSLSKPDGSLFNNGYFQLAIAELFLCTAGLAYYRHHIRQPGQIVLQIPPQKEKEHVNLVLQFGSGESATADTVTAPGILDNMQAGNYGIETLDPEIVYFHTDFVLEPGGQETLLIPVTLNTKSLIVQTDPAGAEIRINGVQATQTPDTFDILSGDTVVLELQMDGYQDYIDTLSLHEDLDLGTIPLQKLYSLWISSRYQDIGYMIYDMDKRVVFSGRGSRNLQLIQGTYRIAYEIGEGAYDTKTFQLKYNLTVSIP
jgi:hypothetical protein